MRHATIEDAAAVRALLDRCEAADGRAPLSEFKLLRVPVANSARTLVADSGDGTISAIAVAAWHPAEIGEESGYWAAEVAVEPSARSVAEYQQVAEALAADLGEAPALWTFDAVQAAAAHAVGFVEVRAIIEMRRSLPVPNAHLPDPLRIQAFATGRDEAMWLGLNQQVFAHHPEAGAIDAADLALRMAQPWFDAEGFLVLFDGAEPVGYCWTKRHSPELGEIYMIGLIPAYRGRGLAKPLTTAGLDYLTRVGAAEAMLFVDAANTTAVHLYEGMGFEMARRVVLFAQP